MNSAGPALRDIHLPQVSWWPPAPGWWLLAVLVLIAAGVSVWLSWRGSRARSTRRAANLELAALAARHADSHDDVALAAGVSRLLRRIALLLSPGAAACEGAAWRAFIAGRARAFTDEQLDTLIDAPYRAWVSFDAHALLAATRRWCDQALRPGAIAARSPS